MEKWEYIWLMVAVIAVFVAIAAVVISRRRQRQVLENISEMLELAINGEFSESRYDESMLSSVEARLSQYLSASEVSSKNLSAEKEKIKELIGDISHQTKTPIANLLLYTQLLSEQELSEESRALVSSLGAQTEKLSFLIGSLVKTSRLEAGVFTLSPKAAPLQPVLESVSEQLGPKAADKGISISLTPCSLSARFDPKWTAEALYNIMDNAVKYTPDGGSVSVSAAAYELFVRIDIADTGIGIAEAEQGKIFSRFYRSPEVSDREGVGIGLYLARQIVAGQGGYIKLASAPGSGSVFSVFLPRD